jgi:hypothetical protein
MREPQLGVAVGKRGIGKTYTTLAIMRSYITGYGGSSKPRRVLIMDVNDEFQQVKAIKLEDIAKFSMHPKIEARRVRPFNADGTKMTLRDVCDALYLILENYKGGLLLIEDINKYLTHNLPKDVVGAICTNRHSDLDIILHYQAIGKVPVTVWENANWIRFHKNNQSVDRHEKKFEDRYEMLKLVEALVDRQYDQGNTRFFVYADLDHTKIKGAFSTEMAKQAIEDVMIEQFRQIVQPEARKLDLNGKKVYPDVGSAATAVKQRLYTKYFSENDSKKAQ